MTQINAHIYDDTGRCKETINIKEVVADRNGYLFVVLENDAVGLINKKNDEFISDEYRFYYVEYK